MLAQKYFMIFLRWLKYLMLVLGSLLIVILMLAFSTRPYYTHHWLGTGIEANCSIPSAVLMLGGGGMPASSNLMRLYYTAKVNIEHPHCLVYLSHPGDSADRASSLRLMADELILRGVPEERIRFLPEGKNTRSQALEVYEKLILSEGINCLVLVTSPAHMRRSILSFRKAGIENIIPVPAFENPFEGDLVYDENDVGGTRRLITPSNGENLNLRYEFWTQMNYQLQCAREFTALTYYWILGWI
jgi:uncharacterized SAM-binding protein YcdF (DUF218 family)